MDKIKELANFVTVGAIIWFVATHSIRISFGTICFVMIHECFHALSAAYYGRFIRFGFHYGQPGVRIESYDDWNNQIIILSGFVGNIITGFFMIPIFFSEIMDMWGYILCCIGLSIFDIVKFIENGGFEV